mmetsp:Transcript_276/g.685  ORF Transcript_276/g.685 Transcript_276/m.685 type:complete len:143 (+) Transcript_276:61-489(+)
MASPGSSDQRKRPRPGEIPSRLIADAAESISKSGTTFTDGAIEGLKVCLEQFLSTIAQELASKDEETAETIQEEHVIQALENMGMSDLVEAAMTAAQKGHNKKKKAKRQKWTQEMEAEQERLLTQSRKTVMNQQDPKKQNPT